MKNSMMSMYNYKKRGLFMKYSKLKDEYLKKRLYTFNGGIEW